jgi:hypothetical protein
MRATASETIAKVNADWAAWQQLRAIQLEQLNQKLRGGKLPPVLVPTGDELRAGEPKGGEELP